MVICCSKTERELTFNEIMRGDPTHTSSTRRIFIAEIDRRFNRLKKAIIEVIVEGKILEDISRNPFTMERIDNYEYKRTKAKAEQFMEWLEEQNQKFILSKGGEGIEVIKRPIGIAGIEKEWTDKYIRSAYQKGIARGRDELRKAGIRGIPALKHIPGGISAMMNQPFHADRVGLIYSRVFEDMKNVSSAMKAQMSRVLAQGMVEGRSPREIARLLTGSESPLEKIGKVRARVIARTEVIRAHHVANIAEYERAGIAGVKVKAEWSTAGFAVCPRCEPLEGKVFELKEIKGMIPLHPNCKCVAIPSDIGEERKEPIKTITRKKAEKLGEDNLKRQKREQ